MTESPSLTRRLAERIAREGPIEVAAFVGAALNDPIAGYYRAREPIGRGGDFITAPEISQVFGELLGAWAIAVAAQIDCRVVLRLVEIGPGRGALILDVIRAIMSLDRDGEFLRRASLHLIEPSPMLRAAQERRLTRFCCALSPEWVDAIGDVPPGPIILFANELFDALPVRQWVRGADGWRLRVVSLAVSDPETFAFAAGPRSDPLFPPSLIDAAEGEILERCPEGEALAGAIGTRLAADGGAALIVDYGHRRSGFGDTLQAVARHRFASVLERPGEQDISHHVDFEALGEVARAAGATVWGPAPQGLFLTRLGIVERAATLMKANPTESDAIAGAVRRLVHPGRMGDLFKVMALTGPDVGEPPGFASTLACRRRDRR